VIFAITKDGEVGNVFPLDAPTLLWAQRIQRLIADRNELIRMLAAAPRFAEKMLNQDRFEGLISQVVDRLRSDNAKGLALPKPNGTRIREDYV
jgi:hypothetical protein